MPTENERKYPLGCWTTAERAIVALPGVVVLHVLQGYLNPETRIRRFCRPDGTVAELVFSYKRTMPAGEAVEIETPLDDDDFVRLAATCTAWLRKRRYKAEDMGTKWDVDFFLYDGVSGMGMEDGFDFFRHDGVVGMVLAEAEMPPGTILPARVLPAIAPWALSPVPRHEGARFSSQRLCSAGHAAELARELGVGAVLMPAAGS
jgi:CYTH domain-containing protein